MKDGRGSLVPSLPEEQSYAAGTSLRTRCRVHPRRSAPPVAGRCQRVRARAIRPRQSRGSSDCGQFIVCGHGKARFAVRRHGRPNGGEETFRSRRTVAFDVDERGAPRSAVSPTPRGCSLSGDHPQVRNPLRPSATARGSRATGRCAARFARPRKPQCASGTRCRDRSVKSANIATARCTSFTTSLSGLTRSVEVVNAEIAVPSPYRNMLPVRRHAPVKEVC